VSAHTSFDSRGQRLHRNCERVTQPIRLVVAHLLQDCLAKLTEYAAHVDVIMGAVAQHDLRVAPVAQWLQRQPMCVLEAIDRSLDPSKQGRLVRDCPCPRASSLHVHRATLRHSACGHPLDISYSIRHSTPLYGQHPQPDAIIRRRADSTSHPMKPRWTAPTT